MRLLVEMERTGWVREFGEVKFVESEGCLDVKVFKDESQISGFITGENCQRNFNCPVLPQDSQGKWMLHGQR